MPSFLAAHGYDPGPTQRPFAVGAIGGAAAAVPAIAVLWWFGSLPVEARILGLSIAGTLALGSAAMAVAGAVYARLFGRAANDRRGGWLFGTAFGFAMWAGGAALVLPLLGGGQTPAGPAAVGLFVSLLLWGGTLGLIVPLVHPHLQERLESAFRSARVGPAAGTSTSRRHERPAGGDEGS